MLNLDLSAEYLSFTSKDLETYDLKLIIKKNKSMEIYNQILNSKTKKIAVLIDPDKHTEFSIRNLIEKSEKANADLFMIGSSLLLNKIDQSIKIIKHNSKIPLILFPGNLNQLSFQVDAILLLSLISGRNPDLLIGKHVAAAPLIKQSGIEAIATGYVLVESGNLTSVEYISNTKPIPANKPDIAIATALAGELLGMKLIYMDAGSGAKYPISAEMIEAVKSNISIPLIIGGGLKTVNQVSEACNAGADIIVVGNILEKHDNMVGEMAAIVHSY